ncbi:hypothetical protein H9Q72_009198 [Fusarium xylarioides]|uniref:Uncharacterized protein n=1 Tax=Fusarium xylarioides TaxID=221167 RepID=A0A9P7L6E5_9HYPO|nr:hypothetical protein H9Q72_009198 [Fusarium xylarioides]
MVFMVVLPHVNYDYRLALFLALDSDDLVRRVKIQLAAVMSTDVNELARLNVTAPLDPEGEDTAMILNSCLGYCSDMAPSGSLWMVLGLWKAWEFAISKGRENALLWSVVTMSKLVTIRVRAINEGIAQTFHQIGIGSAIHKTLEDETRGFSEEQKRVLQSHLLRAYIFQLVAAYPPFKNGETDPEAPLAHRIMANNIEVMMPYLPHYMTSLINIDTALRDSGNDFTLGVSQSLVRFPGRPCGLMDWTAIPKDLVAEWLVEHRPGFELLPALESLTRHHPQNKDEID